MNIISLALRYFFFRVSNIFCVKVSPEKKEFISNVLKNRRPYPEYKLISKARNELLYGDMAGMPVATGSHGASAGRLITTKKLSEVVRRTSVTLGQGRLLFRICRYVKPDNIIELGTASGVSTICLSLGNPSAMIMTAEGNTELANIAALNFKNFNLKNIVLYNCTFSEFLEGIKPMNGTTLVFIDGNHTYDATIGYYHFFRERLTGNYIIIFHDIRWSAGMEKAWLEIKAAEGNKSVIDLFNTGIIFSGVFKKNV